MNEHTVLITGAAGYVGAMLVDSFATRSDVHRIIAIDKEAMPEMIEKHADLSKVRWVRADVSDNSWQDIAKSENPDIVIHTAWQIRELYGKKEKQWQMNVDGSDAVFDFAFTHPSVKRLIHFSTVASYSAKPDNEIDRVFKEEDGFRPSDYLYAEEKRISEEHLKEKYDAHAASGRTMPIVTIIRPAAITGPRGRFARVRFGLQSALSGALKTSRSIWHRIVSALVSFTPVTKKWVRQFVHEDDIHNIVEIAAFSPLSYSYEAFNAAPPGAVVLGKDMAKAVGKKPVRVHPLIIRCVFFALWHLSRGSIPTSRGGWKSYSYPIVVDGTKITRVLGYQYSCDSLTAFTSSKGKYSSCAPQIAEGK
jgi:nucleoside-diphosphate-sugar epimerase